MLYQLNNFIYLIIAATFWKELNKTNHARHSQGNWNKSQATDKAGNMCVRSRNVKSYRPFMNL